MTRVPKFRLQCAALNAEAELSWHNSRVCQYDIQHAGWVLLIHALTATCIKLALQPCDRGVV